MDRRSAERLRARLEDRRTEIERAIRTRVYAIADPTDATEPAYIDGLHAALSAALDYALEAIERGEERTSPPPPVLLVQARIAARSGVGLDTVLRRYLAGHALLSNRIIEEADGIDALHGAALAEILRAQSALFDRLLRVVADEYRRELAGGADTRGRKRAERVRRLLAGESQDFSGLDYDLDGQHLGVVAAGDAEAEAVREVARRLDCRLLLVSPGDGVVWAWLGDRRGIGPEALTSALAASNRLAIGAPAKGIDGWRLTHRQAGAAFLVALRGPRSCVRYADVALLAAVLRDDLLAASLRCLYLTPFERERDGGNSTRGTLRAYFRAGRTLSAAAAALGVNRHTVASRLRAIEQRLGRSIDACAPDLEIALALDEMSPPSSPTRPRSQ